MRPVSAPGGTRVGEIHRDNYAVQGRYTAVHVTLHNGVVALDRIRTTGERMGPIRICHAHRLVYILTDPDQANTFTHIPAALETSQDTPSCGSHRAKRDPYWIVPAHAECERVDPAVLRIILATLS